MTRAKYANVHTRRSISPSGKERIYRYHRFTKRRLYSEPGTPAFDAELARAALDMAPIDPERSQSGRPRPTRIYFIRAEITNLIKIGRAMRPHQRLVELQIGSPDTLTLLGTVEDRSGGALEGYLHGQFAKHLVRGEWFKAEPEILAYIEENGKAPDPRMRHRRRRDRTGKPPMIEPASIPAFTPVELPKRKMTGRLRSYLETRIAKGIIKP